MALARIVCGECGAGVPPGAATCARCGAAVELPGAVMQDAGRVCTLCGYRNPPMAVTCESCGARLQGAPAADAGSLKTGRAKPVPPASARGKGGGPKKEAAASRIEPWQMISGVAVLALIAVIAFTLISRDEAAPPRMTSSSQPQPAAPMAQIQALQEAVDANPRDTAARLRLANMLHDAGMLTRAIDTYNNYLEIEPGDPDARVDLGICYDQLALQDSANAPHYFSLAVREMETAAKSSPSHQPAAFNLGIVNLHMGNLEESNKWLKRAVELNRSSELGMRAEKILQQHAFVQ